ncbi:MAG: hypothetical protein RL038_765 [Actinomycetota bacterium]
MDVPISIWIGLFAIILVMLAVDLFMHRDHHEISVKEAAVWTAIWIAIGLIVGGIIWAIYGSEFGMQYLAGYVIEKSLAIDNVFVWALIFTYFKIPLKYQHQVLFLGVLGALVFRGIFIALGATLIASAGWILYIFGGFLIFTGFKMLVQRNDHMDPGNTRTVKLFKKLVPSTDKLHGAKFFIYENGKRLATPLLLVLVLVEVTDIIFAVDSIPAIFAVTSEPFIVFASNALAILGLRSMYFLLADLMHRFIYLKLGLSFVLIWVGVKMILGHSGFKIPTSISLSVVLVILTSAIVASLLVTRSEKKVASKALNNQESVHAETEH